MPKPHILVVAVDGLRASALGAYGNTTYPTPALDELAAESFLCDSFFAPAGELPAVYRALWQSLHPLRMHEYAAGAATLPSVLAECGYASILVTDSAEVNDLPAARNFDECVRVAGDSAARAEDVSQTTLARLFAVACDIVAAPSAAPQFVWLHARGMYGPWDAPLELQESLRDEGDPPRVESVAPPDVEITERDDPDTAFRYGVAYAAQAIVLDACWRALGNAVAAGGVNNWLVVFLGVRGFPLGEHGRVGGVDPRLHAEQLHMPCMVRFPDGRGRMARSGQLVSPLDLLPTIIEWIGGDVGKNVARRDGHSLLQLERSPNRSWREAIVSSGTAGQCAIRTPSWSLCFDAGVDSQKLFVRPDDRWEANDVAGLCAEVVEELRAMAERTAERIRDGGPMLEEPLADELQGSVA